jgi:hypothetical protein
MHKMKKEPFGSFFVLVFKGTISFINPMLSFLWAKLSFACALFYGDRSFIKPLCSVFFYGLNLALPVLCFVGTD